MDPDPIGNAARSQRRVRKAGKIPPICLYCGIDDIRVLELDHVVSRDNEPDLVGYLCLNCHAVKHEEQRQLGVTLTYQDAPTVLQRAIAWLTSIGQHLIALGQNALQLAAQLTALLA